jgi:hypothetical protein
MSALGHAELPPARDRASAYPREPVRLWPHRFASGSLASRWYLAPMLGIVALVVALAAAAFARYPMPPGVDPGHWLSISYGFVGLPASPDPTNQPLFYSPLLFPFLGALVLATGNPPLAASIFAIALYAAFGLSVVYVARRYLVSGPLQVGLVGLGVLGGTTVQMLFWGGYPNLLGFVLMNGALVMFLAFARTKETRFGVGLYALLILTYFAHDLSFVLLFSTVALATAFLLLLGKLPLGFLLRRLNLLGLAALLASVAAFAGLTAELGISHPSYFLANPSAYSIDEVGELFAPLSRAPALFPAGPSAYLPPLPAAVALAAAPVVALAALALVRRWAPGRVDVRLIVASAWLAAVLAVPGAGYLVRFETDYSRFLYFIPLPFFLVVLLSLERAFAPALVPASTPSPAIPPEVGGELPPDPRARFSSERRRPAVVAAVAVAIVLTFVFGAVTVPTIANNEVAGTASAHDADFLQVAHWLKNDRAPGNVLTVSSAARWTEALSGRNAYTVGPVWLLFDPFQITDAQETYWALAAQNVLVNNASALSFSGFASPELSQAPMYTAYVEGVPFPVLRILPGSLELNATGPGGTHDYPVAGGSTVVSGPAGSPNVTITYASPVGSIQEVCTAPPDGSAVVEFVVVPDSGVTVRSFAVSFSGPPSGAPNLDTDSIDSESASGNALVVSVSGKLGESPVRANVRTTLSVSTLPQWIAAEATPHQWTAVVPDPNGSAPFAVSMRLTSTIGGHPQVALPPWLSTPTYLTNHSIGFLLWPNQTYGSVELTYYEATFGFRVVFQNAEWVVLGR